jgi:hypothetical protein
VGHRFKEAGDGGVDGLKQSLLGATFVGVGVEPAKLDAVDPAGHSSADAAGCDVELSSQSATNVAGQNLGLSGAGLRYSVNGTGLTAMPPSLTLASNTAIDAFT